MTNENKEIVVIEQSTRKEAFQEGKRILAGAFEAVREPLHTMGHNLMDYAFDLAINKLRGSAN